MCSPVSLRILLTAARPCRARPARPAARRGAGAARRGAAGAGGGRGGGAGAARGRRGGRRRGGRRRGRRRRGADGVDVVEHVVAGDAPAGAGAGDGVGVEAVLVDQPAHDRRQQPVVAGASAAAPARRARPRARAARRCRRRAAGAGAARRAGRARRARRRGAGGGSAAVPARRRRRAPARRGAARRRGAAGGAAGGRGVGVADDGDHGADVDRVALGHADLGQRAGDRRRHLGVDLVGGHLEQRLVGGDGVADLLNHCVIVPSVTVSPSCGIVTSAMWFLCSCVDVRRAQPLKLRPVSASTVSPNSSVRLGWGWMNSATSSTVASQLTAR